MTTLAPRSWAVMEAATPAAPNPTTTTSASTSQFCARATSVRCARQPGGAGRQEAIEHPPRAFAELHIIGAVEHPDAVDEDAVDAERVAQCARAATGEVIDPARGRDADGRGVEQQEVGMGADGDAAAVGDAVKPGLMAGKTAHPFGEVKGAALAHPMAEEIEPEPRIAQIDEMGARIG